VATGAAAEFQRYVRSVDPRSADRVPRVGVAAAAEQYRAGRVVMVDVRSPAEYRAVHITEAVSIPAHEVERWRMAIPRGRAVITYCT
jgi:rhodanese-related sulfurtransferase